MRRADRRTTHVTRPDNNAADPRLRAGVFFAFRGYNDLGNDAVRLRPPRPSPPVGRGRACNCPKPTSPQGGTGQRLACTPHARGNAANQAGSHQLPATASAQRRPRWMRPEGLFSCTLDTVSPPRLSRKRPGGPSHAKGRTRRHAPTEKPVSFRINAYHRVSAPRPGKADSAFSVSRLYPILLQHIRM